MIEYKISSAFPPKHIYNETVTRWNANFIRGTVYTYGNTIHIFKQAHMTPDLLEHEKVHVRQQTTYPGGPEAWWQKYFESAEFRYSQELEAYRKQYQVIRERYGTREAENLLNKIAKTLSGPLYGYIVSTSKAREDVERYPLNLLGE